MPTASTAELLVHCHAAIAPSGIESVLQRWRGRGTQPLHPGRHGPLALQVDDLQGQRLADFGDAGLLTRIRLPPGTCIVTASSGALRRSYTLTLEPGRTFHLHLNHWPTWP